MADIYNMSIEEFHRKNDWDMKMAQRRYNVDLLYREMIDDLRVTPKYGFRAWAEKWSRICV